MQCPRIVDYRPWFRKEIGSKIRREIGCVKWRIAKKFREIANTLEWSKLENGIDIERWSVIMFNVEIGNRFR